MNSSPASIAIAPSISKPSSRPLSRRGSKPSRALTCTVGDGALAPCPPTAFGLCIEDGWHASLCPRRWQLRRDQIVANRCNHVFRDQLLAERAGFLARRFG